MKSNYIGVVDKIRVLKNYPSLLVRCTLITTEDKLNCIISDRNVAHHLLLLIEGESEIAVYGHSNKRNQLVIEKMMIRKPSLFEFKFAAGTK